MTVDKKTDEEFDVARLEVVHRAVAVVLVNAAVDRHARVRVSQQVLHQLVGVFLFVHKYEDTATFLVQAKQLQQLQKLVTVLENNLNTRTDHKVSLFHRTDFSRTI